MSVRTTPARSTPIISVARRESDAIMSVAFVLMSETKFNGSSGIHFFILRSLPRGETAFYLIRIEASSPLGKERNDLTDSIKGERNRNDDSNKRHQGRE